MSRSTKECETGTWGSVLIPFRKPKHPVISTARANGHDR
ncbi:MAG: hypothetical protein ACI9W2_000801 [Gammaproteobacteria bacterium]